MSVKSLNSDYPEVRRVLRSRRQLRNMLIVIVDVVSFFRHRGARSTFDLSFPSLPYPIPSQRCLIRDFVTYFTPRPPRPRLFSLSRGRRGGKHLSRTRTGCPRILYSHSQAGRLADRTSRSANTQLRGRQNSKCPFSLP